ncbi:MAG: hypothetical protein WBI17_09770 [Clostridiaceae bacterium]
MIEVLKIISTAMSVMGLNYEFIEFTANVVYPYFVGEYEEVGAINEDGMTESTFILTGTTRGTWLELEQTKEDIERYFDDFRYISPMGSAVSINYNGGFAVPTYEPELKRIQINLVIKEWKVK